MRLLFRALFWASVGVVCWPRVRCDWCGRRVWAWEHFAHVCEHVADHYRELGDVYRREGLL